MKIDFHSHILPGIDDGARTLEEAVQLAEGMAGWGFERITCTPHITNKFRNTPDTIRPAFEKLQEALYAKGGKCGAQNVCRIQTGSGDMA